MPKNITLQIKIGLEVYKRLVSNLSDNEMNMGTGGLRPPVPGAKLEELRDSRNVGEWLKWAVGCCPMLNPDAVLAMQGADKIRHGWAVRRMYLTAIEVQQKSADTAQSVNTTQFFSRMNRAIQGYNTAFQITQYGIEFRDAMTTNCEFWKDVLHEMSEAVELFNKMAQRPDWQDKPIGEGIMLSLIHI